MYSAKKRQANGQASMSIHASTPLENFSLKALVFKAKSRLS